jgi:hypothetical protein
MTNKKAAAENRICEDGIVLDDPAAVATAAAPPFLAKDWRARQRVRNLGRELRRPAYAAASTASRTPQGPRRFDPPPNLFDHLEHVTAPASVTVRPQNDADRTTILHRHRASQIAAWLIVVAGAIALTAGIGLMGWSLVERQMTYWNLAVGLALGGQGTLIFGLVLVVSRLWHNSRYASAKLQEVHARLAQLQHTADALTATRSGGTPAFYADLVRGASPQMLLSNLKGQLDQLATRLGNGF